MITTASWGWGRSLAGVNCSASKQKNSLSVFRRPLSSLLLAAKSLLVIHRSTTTLTFTRILVVFNQKSSMLQLKSVMSCHIHHGHKEQIISVILSAATINVFEGCYHMSPAGILSLDQTTLISFHPGFSFLPLGLWSLFVFSCRSCSAVLCIVSGAYTADIMLQFRLGWNPRVKKKTSAVRAEHRW